ncbi:hypothetical protein GOV13_04575 [Candidatus Pacearchaeota archaeon]|nr:hypothetical protein [Candidatus Pacearchaeota archaeon]
MNLQKLLTEIVPQESFIPRGSLYLEAKNNGYKGSQEALLEKANEMVDKGELIGMTRGINQLRQYRGVKK